MTTKFSIKPNLSRADVISQNAAWLKSITSNDRERISKEIDDLLLNGQAIFNQAGSFSSTRTIHFGSEQVIIIADHMSLRGYAVLQGTTFS